MNEHTLMQAIRIAQALDNDNESPPTDRRYAVVRGDRSGVFAGIVVSEDGQTVEMTDVRHVWYWKGAANTAEMAELGVSDPGECKFTAPTGRVRVLDAIEVIDCTADAERILRAVPVWSEFK